jgi:signal transduction histidine kinase
MTASTSVPARVPPRGSGCREVTTAGRRTDLRPEVRLVRPGARDTANAAIAGAGRVGATLVSERRRGWDRKAWRAIATDCGTWELFESWQDPRDRVWQLVVFGGLNRGRWAQALRRLDEWPLIEAVLALATGVAAFAVTALLGSAARSRLPDALFALFLVAGVAVVAVCTGILFALPVGVAAVLAFDWYFLPPLRALDGNTVLVLGTFLIVSVVVGTVTVRAGHRASASEEARGALAEEQSALRHVATLVARSTPPAELFAAVVTEVGQLLQAPVTVLIRYQLDGTGTLVGTWTTAAASPPVPVGGRLELGGRHVTSQEGVRQRPTSPDGDAGDTGALRGLGRAWGFRSVVAVPVDVDGRLWGAMLLCYEREEALPADTEARLAGFTELIATAIANAQARVELRDRAAEQAALRRVATLVALEAPPDEVFDAVTGEVGELLDVELALLNRYEVDGSATVLGAWARAGSPLPVPVGSGWTGGGENATTPVLLTGRPTRIDDYTGGATGPAADLVRAHGFQAMVGAPITVDSQVWGFVSVHSRNQESLPAGTETRLVGFTELVGTALANAEAQAALTASRARVVAAGDEMRRHIERGLHDGIQQGLLALILQAAAAGELRDDQADQMRTELFDLRTGLVAALDELRETARGIHPSILTEAGLGGALSSLARRCPVPVVLDVQAGERMPEPVEVAAYYVVSEALTNAVKHAGCSEIEVTVSAGEGVLHVRVRDNGRGGADATRGSGLVGLTDRVEALGGRLLFASPPGQGTTLHVTVPLAAQDGPEGPSRAQEPPSPAGVHPGTAASDRRLASTDG